MIIRWRAAVIVCGLLWLAASSNLPGGAVQAAFCPPRLANGDFELQAQGWTQTGSASPLIDTFKPHTGDWSAHLGGAHEVEHALRQAVNLPAAGNPITLEFWWAMDTEETYGAGDILSIALLHPNGTPIVELWRVDATQPAFFWDSVSLDLTAYAGQDVIVQVSAETDALNATDFYVDGISLPACTAPVSGSHLPLVVR